MGLFFYKWSRTAASNASADANVNFAEGQAPSSVNDSARALMASAAGYRDDVAGAITTGGSATAYTVTSYQIFDSLANLSGQMIAFTPHATNTNTVGTDITLAVDGLAAKSIRAQPSVALPNGSLILGTPYVVLYNNADGVFYLQGQTNPYNIPLGAGMDYWLATAPNSSFVFPIGQQISRTTYATLFAAMSTTYGTGDGSTTFNLPDKRGRASVAADSSAGRITGAVFTSLGAGGTGGGENSTLNAANLPAYTPTGTITNGAITSIAFNAANLTSSSGGGNAVTTGNFSATGVLNLNSPTVTQAGSSFTGNAQGGVSTPVRTVQPSIVCNYIIRVI